LRVSDGIGVELEVLGQPDVQYNLRRSALVKQIHGAFAVIALKVPFPGKA
jgi:hypothetical protein